MNKTRRKDSSQFLTTSQAAALLNLSTSTFKKYISSGKVKAIRTPGGHYRVNRKVLMERLYA